MAVTVPYVPLTSHVTSTGRPYTAWPQSYTFPDRLWVSPPDLTVKVQAVKMMRNLLAPIEIRDGTIIPDADQQFQEVFGTIPLHTTKPLTAHKNQLLVRIDQKLLLHRPRPKPKPRGAAQRQPRPARHRGNIPNPPKPQNPPKPNPSQLLGQLIVRHGHTRRNDRHPTSPISSRCEGKGCVLRYTA